MWFSIQSLVASEVAVSEVTSTGLKHKVEAGETLYAISRRYNCTVESIRAANPRKVKNNTIVVGSVLTIPDDETNNTSGILKIGEPFETADLELPTETRKTHLVQAGETLYSLAMQYRLSEQQIILWNQLEPEELPVGKTIFVSEAEIASSPIISDKHSSLTESKIEATEVATEVDKSFKNFNHFRTGSNYSQYIQAQNAPKGLFTLVKGKGVATWSPNNGDSNENLYALHKDAPMHSIMRVRNPVNGRVIYVKVLGELPDTDEYEDVTMLLAPATAKKLNMLDERLILEYSFYK